MTLKGMTLERLKATYEVLKRNRDRARELGYPAEVATYEAEMEQVKAEYRTKKARNARRNAYADAMRSCGLVRVIGAQGGVYWE